MSRQVTFIGVGAQKCASTWLHGVLTQFDDVFVSDPKELDFFTAYFDRGYEWYERHFEDGASVRHKGEVSPSYLPSMDAPARVAGYNRDMRILVTLRDPVDRAFSNHLHEVRAGHVGGANLAFENGLSNNPLYREQGFYAKHLKRWLDHFPQSQIHVVFQEDVKADSLGEAQRLARFLSAEMPDAIVQRRANESIDYKNKLIGTALWRVGRAARQNGLGAAVESIKAMPGVRQLRAANQKDMRAVVEPMKPGTEAELIDLFSDDVDMLAGIVGRRPPWKRFEVDRAAAE